MGSENRLLGADFLRVCACFIVLFHHVFQRLGYDRSFPNLGWFSIFGVIGGLGVAMFFVLSGYLLSRPFWQALARREPIPSIGVYATRRAARILPGFWLALTVTFAFTLFLVQDGSIFWLVLRYLAGLLLVSDWHWTTLFPVEINGPLWSIAFEVTAYVFLPFGFALIFWLARRIKQYWALWMLWLLVIGLALGAHWLFVNFVHVDQTGAGWDKGMQGGAKVWMPRINPFSMFVIFAVGAMAGGLQVKLSRFRNLVFDLLTLLAAAAAIYLIGGVWTEGKVEAFALFGVPYAFPLLPLALGVFLAVTPSSRFVGIILDNPLVSFLARISFGIYVWHYLVIELVKAVWFPQIITGTKNTTLFLESASVTIIISIVIAYLSFRYMENPIIQWARRREGNRPPAALAVPA